MDTSAVVTSARPAVESIASHILTSALSNGWFDHKAFLHGIAIRQGQAQYYIMPSQGDHLGIFAAICCFLRCEAALAISSEVVSSLTKKMVAETAEIPLTLNDGKPALRVQVVESLQDYPMLRRAQNAAFFRQEQLLLVWDTDALAIENSAIDLEERMVNFIWKSAAPKLRKKTDEDKTIKAWKTEQRKEQSKIGHVSPETERSSPINLLDQIPVMDITQAPIDAFTSKDAEGNEEPEYLRPTSPLAAIQIALAIVLAIFVLVYLGIGEILETFLLSHSPMVLLLIIPMPLKFVIALFACMSLVSFVFLVFGPISLLKRNTRYFSGTTSKRLTRNLPHVTVQMPVYKEKFATVIAPSLLSIKAAIRTYELQGGTASILVSDDGLLLIDEEQRQERLLFYDRHDINWVARPKQSENYVRAGRFKKASNLNFTCQLAMLVEKYVQDAIEVTEDDTIPTFARTSAIAQDCIRDIACQLHPEALAHGDVRIGDLVLLVDSDTRVPEDCFLDSASEMAQSQDVAILQHGSGVMMSDKPDFFEKGIAFFTETVNFAISYAVSTGQVAPFMGHNAFLRWSAIQEVMQTDDKGNVITWAENMVSEDFDMALRLIQKGYTIRWATYSNEGFQEGVSLTYIDELNRWTKYAWGVAELLFHPFVRWPRRGPFTKHIRSFMWSRAPIFYRFNVLGYMASYFAIAVAFPLVIALAVVEGWYSPYLNKSFVSNFRVLVFVCVLFNALSPLSFAIARARARSVPAHRAFLQHIKWMPFFVAFFTALSFHLLTSFTYFFFSINLTWGATVKEVGNTNFRTELPVVFKRFWKTFLVCLAFCGLFAVLSTHLLPFQWQIDSATIVFPPLWFCGMHILSPFLLDPALLNFSY